jgi:hypothetical protein
MAYVAISRAEVEVKIFTDSPRNWGGKLSRENSKTMALEHTAAKQNEVGREVGRSCPAYWCSLLYQHYEYITKRFHPSLLDR